MKRIYQLLALIGFGLCLTACSIDEKTTFNKDFSGQSQTSTDMSAILMFISSMDSSGGGKDKFYEGLTKGLNSKMDSVRQTPEGAFLKNVDISFDSISNIIKLTNRFENLEAINQLSEKMQETNQQLPTSAAVKYEWKKKGKILVMPGVSGLDALSGLPSMPSDGKMDMQGMLKTITYSIVRTFPKKISKVSDKRIVISDDKKTMTFKATLEALQKEPLKDITIIFK